MTRPMRVQRQCWRRRVGWGALAALSLLVGLASGCAERLSLANYEKLKVGQPYAEVVEILGEPTRCDELLGVRTCDWGTPERGVNVRFVASQVLLTQARNLH